MIQLNRRKKDPFLYRFTVECLGRSLEIGLSYEELEGWKSRGRQLFGVTEGWDKTLSALRGKLPWRAVSTGAGRGSGDARKKRRATAHAEAAAAT
jgi:hypothetical protein